MFENVKFTTFDSVKDDMMAIQMVSGMSGIEALYDRLAIITSLQKFQAEHKVEYADAMTVYNEDVQKKVKELTKKVRDLGKVAKKEDADKIVTEAARINGHFALVRPVDCDKEYSKLIFVFQQMTDEKIKLDIEEANHIFNNDWAWVQSASTTNSVYAARMKK